MMLDQIEYSSPTAEDDHEGFSCMSSLEAAGSVKRKNSKNKKRFSDEQIRSLESLFESESRLEPRKKMQLAKELGLQPRQVAIWFQNKRARWKSKQLERDYSILRANYNNLASKFEALKKEKQALVIQVQKLNDLMRERPEEERQSCGESDNGDAARSESDQIASCESLSLESSYEKATGCIYASTLLYEYRGLTRQPVNINSSCFQWHLAYCERFSTDFYLTDQKSGLRATVKAGSGCKVIPLVVESKLVNTKRCRLLSPHLRKWLSERNLSSESRLLRLEEGYVQEGSSVTVFGMLHRNNEITTIVQPPEVISTGCLWRKLLLPVDIDGLILRVSQLAQHSANPNSIQ